VSIFSKYHFKIIVLAYKIMTVLLFITSTENHNIYYKFSVLAMNIISEYLICCCLLYLFEIKCYIYTFFIFYLKIIFMF